MDRKSKPWLRDDGNVSEIPRRIPETLEASGENPRSEVPPPQLTSPPEHLRKLYGTFEKWLYLTSHETINVVAATYLANLLQGARLWLCLIGPSSCGKTTMAESLLGLPNVHQINSLTTGAFASGHVSRENPSARFGMFQNLDEKSHHLLVVPDFSSILRKDPRIRGEIFGQLRSIYDGSWKQTFGSGVEVDWKGKVAVVACATPNFEKEISSEVAFGERFLYWKMPPVDTLQVGERSLRNSERTDEMRQEFRRAMRATLSSIPLNQGLRLPLSIRNQISRETSNVALARTPISRDPYSHEICDIPRTESTARITQQLGQLLKGLLVLFQTNEVSSEILSIIEGCAYSCIPEPRLRLMAIAGGRAFGLSDAIKLSRLPPTVVRRTLEELTLLGLLRRERRAKANSSLWQAEEVHRAFFRRVKTISVQFGFDPRENHPSLGVSE